MSRTVAGGAAATAYSSSKGGSKAIVKKKPIQKERKRKTLFFTHDNSVNTLNTVDGQCVLEPVMAGKAKSREG